MSRIYDIVASRRTASAHLGFQGPDVRMDLHPFRVLYAGYSALFTGLFSPFNLPVGQPRPTRRTHNITGSETYEPLPLDYESRVSEERDVLTSGGL